MHKEIGINSVPTSYVKDEDFVVSFARGIKLLEAFGVEKQKLNVTQIATRSQLSRTATRRYLRTLYTLGYLDSDDHYYWLTHRVLRFSSAYLNSSHLSKISQPILNLLSVETKFTFSVVVLDEHEVVPIARSYLPQQDNLRISPYGMHLGNRLPAHATSTGKVLLASLDETLQQEWLKKYGLKRLTSYTEIDEHVFLASLKQVAIQDYCLSSEEHELGVIALAVPVVNTQGKYVAALNCIAQSNKTTATYLIEKILPLLRNTVAELRAMI
ncbi:IclR family transcriptional regulator domain-containing protein [Acinetobacter rudis]|uniref:IclR family transcriptional regulator, pca regulon regulatory protein n=1 Tax=Acinetobacter rudis CIP 110305 TaxID=421052 RepID=S3N9Q2_9GAMM|nr:IclR family transcriptional regulator C-terminal domain-containing protein [Acinetobacter rudis]EPF71079.1 IclR family transcriptional regulator, pca regulon regulatory protein [Acinetobacter rudis CIP 110305]